MKTFLLTLILSCSTFLLMAQEQQVSYRLFLIGDAGEPQTDGTDPVLNNLKKHLAQAGRNSAVVFLGDNIYPRGLRNVDDPNRKSDEHKLATQLDVIKEHAGLGYVIPGNHDWEQGGKHGLQYIKNQEAFVTEYLQKNDVFFPKGGCPTPQEIHLSPTLTLVLLDTQWPLHPWDKPAEHSDCDIKTLPAMLTAVDDILYRNQDKKVVVLGHHPMYSHGTHGGYFTLKDHLLPLHELGVNIPLPVIGSIYPLYRSLIGDIQDIQNPTYKEMRDGLTDIFKQYPNVVYANGHEHTMQWIVRDSINYITAGSGSKSTPVRKAKDALFTSESKGFAVIELLTDNSLRLKFIKSDNSVLLEQALITKKPLPPLTIQDRAHASTIPNPAFKANAFKKWLLGANYRDIWTKPLVTPILHLKEEQQGLSIIQRGGGQQTLSLRYKASNGKEFVTRSVEKYPESAVPAAIRSRFTVEVVGDQISASHPFAALAIPTLAEAVGVLHTNPKLVTLENGTTLGKYQRLFANQLAIFEERPDEGFAGAKKIYSTSKLREKLEKDNKNAVDQKAFVKARLLDILIGDWDRHEDQWRWAAYEEGKETVFRPIPRDRDQAFFVSQGILPKIVSRKWILPKVQGFGYTIRDVNTFNANANEVDHSFLTALSQEDWLTAAQAIQQQITDSVITEALAKMPEPDEHKSEIAAKLQQRRTDLKEYARTYYRFLAKEVDVMASDKDELIEVIRQEDGKTDVSVYDLNKKEQKSNRIYHRLFDPKETKEIRIWGLDGEDRFEVKGNAHRGIRVRLIGGKGKDAFYDSSAVELGSKKTLVYDKIKNTILQAGEETVDKTTDNKASANNLSTSVFNYNRLAPLASFAYNADDGLFIGGGIQFRKNSFRKTPYASEHSLTGNYAFSTDAFNLYYAGNFIDLIGKTDLQVKLTLQQEGLVNNFFGMSNESVYLKEKGKGIQYYRTKLSNYENSLIFRNHVDKAVFYYGIVYSGYNVKPNASRFINEYAPIGSNLYQERDYLGTRVGVTLDTRNNPNLTTQGMLLDVNATYQHGILTSIDDEIMTFKTAIAFYHTFKLPASLTFATRFGGAFNVGNYEFYQANTLGGLSNLRGFRDNRFSGQQSFYNNTEIRAKLMSIKSYLFPLHIGILGFSDVGRVWNVGEKSNKWHHGYGGGVWVSPFDLAVITGTYSVSEDDQLFNLKLGFFF